MTWPTVNVTTTNLDADTDSPLAARPDLYDLATKFNQVRAHVSTFAATVLDDADATAVRSTIGISATNTPNTPAGNIAATNVQTAINELDSEKAGLALSNVFTASIQRISNVAPRFQLNESDAPADEKLWDIGAGGGGLLFRTRTDADGTGENFLTIVRTGTNVDTTSIYGDTVNLTATTINANGALAVSGLITATGGQIKFPATQVPSADANTLDDYEEGTWTPSIGGTATYTTQSGTYTKIGRKVFIRGKLGINVSGTGHYYRVSGLPFASADNTAGTVSVWASIATAAVCVVCYAEAGLSSLYFRGTGAAAVTTGTGTVWGNSANVFFSCTYEV